MALFGLTLPTKGRILQLCSSKVSDSARMPSITSPLPKKPVEGLYRCSFSRPPMTEYIEVTSARQFQPPCPQYHRWNAWQTQPRPQRRAGGVRAGEW